MNKKAVGNLLIVLSLLLILIQCLFGVFYSLVLMLAIVFIAIFALKDDEVAKKTLQSLFVVLTVFCVQVINYLVLGTIDMTVLLFGGYSSISVTSQNVITIICNIYLIVFFILGVIFFAAKKDMPIYGDIVKAIYGEQREKNSENKDANKKGVTKSVDNTQQSEIKNNQSRDKATTKTEDISTKKQTAKKTTKSTSEKSK